MVIFSTFVSELEKVFSFHKEWTWPDAISISSAVIMTRGHQLHFHNHKFIVFIGTH